MDSRKVSILIPTYNQEKFIKKAILSALQQTYSNLEVIVADDNSTDNTQQIVEELQKEHRNLVYHKNEVNLGRVANYHFALYQLSHGDWVLNLDGDDYLTDMNYISDAMQVSSEKENVVLVFARMETYFEKDNSFVTDTVNTDLPRHFEGDWLFINYPKGYSIPHLTSLYDRKYAMEIGFYNKNILSSDWESFLRLIQGKQVGFVNKVIGVWNKHGHNASRSIAMQEIMDNAEYVESAYRYAVKKSTFDADILKKWHIEMLKRYYAGALLKVLLLESSKVKLLKENIKNIDETIYKAIQKDIRFFFLEIVGKSRFLLYVIFKYIFKQESFIKDLES